MCSHCLVIFDLSLWKLKTIFIEHLLCDLPCFNYLGARHISCFPRVYNLLVEIDNKCNIKRNILKKSRVRVIG